MRKKTAQIFGKGGKKREREGRENCACHRFDHLLRLRRLSHTQMALKRIQKVWSLSPFSLAPSIFLASLLRLSACRAYVRAAPWFVRGRSRIGSCEPNGLKAAALQGSKMFGNKLAPFGSDPSRSDWQAPTRSLHHGLSAPWRVPRPAVNVALLPSARGWSAVTGNDFE